MPSYGYGFTWVRIMVLFWFMVKVRVLPCQRIFQPEFGDRRKHSLKFMLTTRRKHATAQVLLIDNNMNK